MKTINMIIMAIVATMMVVGTAMAGPCYRPNNGCDITSTTGVAIDGGAAVTMQGFKGVTLSTTNGTDGLNTSRSIGATKYNGAAVGTSANGIAVSTAKVDKNGRCCCNAVDPSANGSGTFKAEASGVGAAGSIGVNGSRGAHSIAGEIQGAAMTARYSTSSVVTVNAR